MKASVAKGKGRAGGAAAACAPEGQTSVAGIFKPAETWRPLLAKFVVMNFQPLSLVENKEFRDVITALNPKATIPSRKSLYSDLFAVKLEHEEVIGQILRGQYVGVTVDSWTSCAHETYVSLTLQLINESFEMVNLPLDCVKSLGSSTGNDYEMKIRDLLDRRGLSTSQVAALVTDCEPAMCKAGRALPFAHIGCTAHRIESTTGIMFNQPGKNLLSEI
jgi:hypothetical protein